MEYPDKKEKKELKKFNDVRDKIIERETARDLCYIRPAHFANLAGFWKSGQLSLGDVAEILNTRKIDRIQIGKLYGRMKGRRGNELALALLRSCELHYFKYEGDKK